MTYASSVTCFNALPPRVVRAIHEAFDDAVGILEKKTPMNRWSMGRRAAVARRIVDLAKHGEHDVMKLRDGGLAALRESLVN